MPCRAYLTTLPLVDGLELEFEGAPVLTIDGDLLLQFLQRQVILTHPFECQKIIGRQKECGRLLVNKPHSRDQVCDRSYFICWAIGIGEPRHLGNQMHLVNRGLVDLQIGKQDSRVLRVLFQDDLVQRPGTGRFEA